ncbi:hypothetical protein TNIN_142061 [Trichonephila inaurata madagascariensis]|uniref:Uncharacterized protein n=1 Tax=Trichonephila inaurata madagascariensis TaxID=2747483 RepID=A0A8X6XMQ7_9ARAC|nr:hypothetical protein TNIN_142061 [Trichonephila inaurata madagascariensis]
MGLSMAIPFFPFFPITARSHHRNRVRKGQTIPKVRGGEEPYLAFAPNRTKIKDAQCVDGPSRGARETRVCDAVIVAASQTEKAL